jgi:hypothetical protein
MSEKTSKPDHQPHQGLSRRDLFRTAGLATGGAMLLGLPQLISGLVTKAEAAPLPSYDVVDYALELGGDFAGYIDNYSGGNAFAEIALEPEGLDMFQRKRPGPVRFEDITLTLNWTSIRKPLSLWITESLTKTPTLRNGAIVFYNTATSLPVKRLEFFNATLSEVMVPPLIPSVERPDTILTLRITPQSTVFAKPVNLSSYASSYGYKSLPLHFSFMVQGLESTSPYIQSVAGIGVKRIGAQKFDCSMMRIELPAQESSQFYEWFHTMVIRGNAAAQRGGQLIILNTENKPLGSVQLGGLGIVGCALGGQDKNHMAYIDMYCETINFPWPT